MTFIFGWCNSHSLHIGGRYRKFLQAGSRFHFLCRPSWKWTLDWNTSANFPYNQPTTPLCMLLLVGDFGLILNNCSPLSAKSYATPSNLVSCLYPGQVERGGGFHLEFCGRAQGSVIRGIWLSKPKIQKVLDSVQKCHLLGRKILMWEAPAYVCLTHQLPLGWVGAFLGFWLRPTRRWPGWRRRRRWRVSSWILWERTFRAQDLS